MKLNKTQIEALAGRIASDVRKPYIEKNNAVKESEGYKSFIDSEPKCKVIMEAATAAGVESIGKNLCEKYRDSCYEHEFVKVPHFSYYNTEIINEIVLETIECDNLEQLIEKISNKYKIDE